MNKVDVEATNLTVPDLTKLAKKGPVILTRRGKPVAAVKDLSGSDWESIALANNPRFLALIEESRRSYREQGGNPARGGPPRIGPCPQSTTREAKKERHADIAR